MFVCKKCAYAFSLVLADVTVSFFLSFDCLDDTCFYFISLHYFFNCSLHVFLILFVIYEFLLSHTVFHEGFNSLDVINASVCLCSVALRSPLRAEHHHRGWGGGVPASL